MGVHLNTRILTPQNIFFIQLYERNRLKFWNYWDLMELYILRKYENCQGKKSEWLVQATSLSESIRCSSVQYCRQFNTVAMKNTLEIVWSMIQKFEGVSGIDMWKIRKNLFGRGKQGNRRRLKKKNKGYTQKHATSQQKYMVHARFLFILGCFYFFKGSLGAFTSFLILWTYH